MFRNYLKFSAPGREVRPTPEISSMSDRKNWWESRVGAVLSPRVEGFEPPRPCGVQRRFTHMGATSSHPESSGRSYVSQSNLLLLVFPPRTSTSLRRRAALAAAWNELLKKLVCILPDSRHEHDAFAVVNVAEAAVAAVAAAQVDAATPCGTGDGAVLAAGAPRPTAMISSLGPAHYDDPEDSDLPASTNPHDPVAPEPAASAAALDSAHVTTSKPEFDPPSVRIHYQIWWQCL